MEELIQRCHLLPAALAMQVHVWGFLNEHLDLEQVWVKHETNLVDPYVWTTHDQFDYEAPILPFANLGRAIRQVQYWTNAKQKHSSCQWRGQKAPRVAVAIYPTQVFGNSVAALRFHEDLVYSAEVRPIHPSFADSANRGRGMFFIFAQYRLEIHILSKRA